MQAAIQAPVILMSQRRQAQRDRLCSEHDCEVNHQAELEIMQLHTKLDDLRQARWDELLRLQREQLALLAELAKHGERRPPRTGGDCFGATTTAVVPVVLPLALVLPVAPVYSVFGLACGDADARLPTGDLFSRPSGKPAVRGAESTHGGTTYGGVRRLLDSAQTCWTAPRQTTARRSCRAHHPRPPAARTPGLASPRSG